MSAEAAFQAQVVELARWRRWPLVYHTFDSRRSAPGFPDVVLVRPGRMVALELKAANGKPTPQQLEWVAQLDTVPGVDALVAYPRDLDAVDRLLA